MKTVGVLLICLLGLVVLIGGGFLIKALWFTPHTIDQSMDMAYGIVDQTLDADNAIYNYEWFKQQEADIRKGIENEKIAQEEYDTFVSSLPELRIDWSDFDKREEASLRASISAIQKVTNSAIEDYNARASMANRNIFNDNLPSNISRAFYTALDLIN